MTVRRAMTLVAIAAVALILVGTPAISQTPRSGGSLTLTLRKDLSQGFAVHLLGDALRDTLDPRLRGS